MSEISPTILKSQYVQYIDEHPFFPEDMKREVRALIINHFNQMSQLIATIELSWRRAQSAIKEEYQ